jgi:uncharacterized protein (DUF1499 family)
MDLATAFFLLTAAIHIPAGDGKPEPAEHPGMLAPCPASPNCVSSQDTDAGRRLPPLTLIGKPVDAIAAVRQVLLAHKRTRIVKQTDNYIHAEVRSALFGFVDDVEFLVAGDSRLHFRSAARKGTWDLGVNRRRMVRLREMLISRYGSLFSDK